MAFSEGVAPCQDGLSKVVPLYIYKYLYVYGWLVGCVLRPIDSEVI